MLCRKQGVKMYECKGVKIEQERWMDGWKGFAGVLCQSMSQ